MAADVIFSVGMIRLLFVSVCLRQQVEQDVSDAVTKGLDLLVEAIDVHTLEHPFVWGVNGFSSSPLFDQPNIVARLKILIREMRRDRKRSMASVDKHQAMIILS
jgi:hypothetical protein